MERSTRDDDLEWLRAWVHAGEPVHGLGSGDAYGILKRRYPREYWDAVIERDRKIYDEKGKVEHV